MAKTSGLYFKSLKLHTLLSFKSIYIKPNYVYIYVRLSPMEISQDGPIELKIGM